MADFWRDKRVLVAGGSGFVGSHLVECLLAAGARVTATASSEASLGRFLAPVLDRIAAAVGDLRDSAQARRAVQGHDVVMYLAARVGGIAYNVAHPASLFRENLTPFFSFIEAAREACTPRFLSHELGLRASIRARRPCPPPSARGGRACRSPRTLDTAGQSGWRSFSPRRTTPSSGSTFASRGPSTPTGPATTSIRRRVT
jgi:hypothetical protein